MGEEGGTKTGRKGGQSSGVGPIHAVAVAPKAARGITFHEAICGDVDILEGGMSQEEEHDGADIMLEGQRRYSRG